MTPMSKSFIYRDRTGVIVPETIIIQQTKCQGRPRKEIDVSFLREAMDPRRKISISKLAQCIGVHRNTLAYYLKHHKVDTKFSALSDKDLDLLVKSYRHTNPESGIRYLIGFLCHHGLCIQGERVRKSIQRVDRLGKSLRQRTTVKARQTKYEVTRPNAMWHIDGHHKLIAWGIVIHGVVDGYSRTVHF